jgi:hypothetical protein
MKKCNIKIYSEDDVVSSSRKRMFAGLNLIKKSEAKSQGILDKNVISRFTRKKM